AVIGGGVGLAALGAALCLGAAARGSRRLVLGLLAAAAMLAAGVVFLVDPGDGTAVQTLALVSLTAVTASVFPLPRWDRLAGTRFRQRRSGRSTST
ncbi:MAG: hypothetical protein JWQ37_2231, partial [Blastococcus sp.]|nr:hypothetical protein [Blastococcus sp.]